MGICNIHQSVDGCVADAGIFAGDASDFVSVSADGTEKIGVTDRHGNYSVRRYGSFLYKIIKMDFSAYACNFWRTF